MKKSSDSKLQTHYICSIKVRSGNGSINPKSYSYDFLKISLILEGIIMEYIREICNLESEL